MEKKYYKYKYPYIEFRISRDIYDLLEYLAKANNVGVNEFCRRIILGYLRAKGYIP